ncbi:hypothetical protein BDV29DRAFT_199657 [Aspergillus leporis]|uniref:GST N-terminal domain-containing protein n=1 Tax=Aspergillus leporis TaxID=41062 RepID=A0A5N5WLJ7_9EURO|nr:hypothetical protein BDV29DRAFT_199657 [Aspergillus leporis]
MSSIVVYHYVESPVSQLVRWYLALREIDHSQCLQPMTRPRPDVAILGVGYRLIPLVAIDRDIFCDTPLILDELEARTKGQERTTPKVTAGDSHERFLRQWSTESVFPAVVPILPSNMPMLSDEFLRDRAQLTGPSLTRDQRKLLRPMGLSKLRQEFHFVETVLLAEDQLWILGTSEPSLGDLYAVWPFAWAISIPGALDGRFVSIATERSRAIKVTTVNGENARQAILGSSFRVDAEVFDKLDPCGYRLDSLVEVSPTDWGKNNPTRGKLVGLSVQEYILEVEEKSGGALRVHFPRRGFALKPVSTSKI